MTFHDGVSVRAQKMDHFESGAKCFPNGLDTGCESEESRMIAKFYVWAIREMKLPQEEQRTLQMEQVWDGEFSIFISGILYLRNLLDVQV